MEIQHVKYVFFLLIFSFTVLVVFSDTDPNDLEIILQFRDGLENPELLKWPENGDDPCGPPKWLHVYCSGNRVSQIQVQSMGLKGPLPQNLNKLSKLSNLGLQRNGFTGMLPSLSGLSELRWVYLDYNKFDSIPMDFIDGVVGLEVLALDGNNFNGTSGWSLPNGLKELTQLVNFTCVSCNLVGPLPDFIGELSSLSVLELSTNRLSGKIPDSLNGSSLQMLWLNDQGDQGMTGAIDVIATMLSLKSLWLHGNHFTGTIPENIGDLVGLKDLNLNGNELVGIIPDSLANMKLDKLNLDNNHLMGPLPKFQAKVVTFDSNQFCLPDPGTPCAPDVMSLLEFLGGLLYPSKLVYSWTGNDPCGGNWLGLICNSKNSVYMIHMSKFGLNGTLSPSIAKLAALEHIILGNNHLTGSVPEDWTSLKLLKELDLSANNISPPLPKFNIAVKITLDGNPLLNGNQSEPTPPPSANTPPASVTPETPTKNSSSSITGSAPKSNSPKEDPKKKLKMLPIVAIIACFAVLICLVIPLSVYCCKKKNKGTVPATSSLVVHPREPSDPDNMVKIVVANNMNGSSSTRTETSGSSSTGESHVIEAGNLVISVQILRNVTKNFAPENELGRGGFGVVYKGELDDGTKIAVKRMESGVISTKALDEFHSEIAVLSKVRHRHLVSLLGYSAEGNERMLVYEYLSQGALSRHLFHWKAFKLEPLSWKRRLNIALDVARAMEYLHNLAHQSFIHRDLKSSNILLADDFRAKVSDFGLVKLAPDGEKSLVTRLAGTFGYLAPEYAVTGKVTTKVDVFSFGVVLMELLTGLVALDDDRAEETQYLAAWFWKIKSDREKLMSAIDPSLNIEEETFETISIISELAGHCTAREPSQRPDMGHAVNVLSPLVEKWKPMEGDTEEYSGIDYNLPLTQLVKDWQESEGKDFSFVDLDDSKGSIPARPTGFAESFNSADGR